MAGMFRRLYQLKKNTRENKRKIEESRAKLAKSKAPKTALGKVKEVQNLKYSALEGALSEDELRRLRGEKAK